MSSHCIFYYYDHLTKMPDDIIELYQLAANGDLTAEKRLFEALLVRFSLFLRRRIWNAQDAEEIMQEALLVIGREYKSTTFDKSFAAWAYKVLDNRIMAYIKSKTRSDDRVVPIREMIENKQGSDPDPDLVLQINSCMKKVCEANRRYGRVLALHFQGYDTAEICRRVKVKRNNCWTILSRAREMLKNCLSGGDTA